MTRAREIAVKRARIDRAGTTKRSRAADYAGIDNPLFYKPGTKMLFSDSKDAIEKVVAALRS